MGRPKLPPPETMTWMAATYCPVCGNAAEHQIIIAKTYTQARKIIKQYGVGTTLPLGISKTVCEDCKKTIEEQNAVFILEGLDEIPKDFDKNYLPVTGRYVCIKKEALTNLEKEADYYLMPSTEFKKLFDKEENKEND